MVRQPCRGARLAALTLLVDTQILVWLGSGSTRLTPAAGDALVRRDEPVAVSAVTAFEYADLFARACLPTPMSLGDVLAEFELDVVGLPAGVFGLIPNLPDIHRDPVDRMLIAHALVAGAGIVTADANIHLYPVRCIR